MQLNVVGTMITFVNSYKSCMHELFFQLSFQVLNVLVTACVELTTSILLLLSVFCYSMLKTTCTHIQWGQRKYTSGYLMLHETDIKSTLLTHV